VSGVNQQIEEITARLIAGALGNGVFSFGGPLNGIIQIPGEEADASEKERCQATLTLLGAAAGLVVALVALALTAPAAVAGMGVAGAVGGLGTGLGAGGLIGNAIGLGFCPEPPQKETPPPKEEKPVSYDPGTPVEEEPQLATEEEEENEGEKEEQDLSGIAMAFDPEGSFGASSLPKKVQDAFKKHGPGAATFDPDGNRDGQSGKHRPPKPAGMPQVDGDPSGPLFFPKSGLLFCPLPNGTKLAPQEQIRRLTQVINFAPATDSSVRHVKLSTKTVSAMFRGMPRLQIDGRVEFPGFLNAVGLKA